MSKFRTELKVIPRAAWITTYIIFALAAIGAGVILCLPRDAQIPNLIWMPIAILPLLMLSVFVLLVGYVNGDAHRRSMRNALQWTLLAIFIPNGIGILLYFFLRDPLPVVCPSCSETHKPGLAYCPNCGAATERSCPQCHRPVEESWKNCAHCGARLN